MAGVVSLSYGVGVSLKPLGGGGGGRRRIVVRAELGASSSSSDEAGSLRQCGQFCRRDVVLSAAVLSAGPFLQSFLPDMAGALIEADDDEELLEKVKGDRQKRIQNLDATSELKDETASLQVAVYKLSKAGQAIEKNDLAAASGVLGTALDSDWITKMKSAFSKVSKNAEQQGEAERFTSFLGSLQYAVFKQDTESAKSAFVASATALEKWTSLAGLTEQIKGL